MFAWIIYCLCVRGGGVSWVSWVICWRESHVSSLGIADQTTLPRHDIWHWTPLDTTGTEETVRGVFKQSFHVLEASGSCNPSDTISNYKKMSGNIKSLRQIIIIWSSPCLIFSELTLRHSKLAEEKEKEDSHQDQGKGEQQPGEHFKRSPEGGRDLPSAKF